MMTEYGGIAFEEAEDGCFSFAIRKWFLLPMKKISSAMQEILKGKTEYRIQEFSNVEEFSELESTPSSKQIRLSWMHTWLNKASLSNIIVI